MILTKAACTSALALLILVSTGINAEESCTTLRGRARLYGGDGQLRIWHIGTHHDFTPDDSSWRRVVYWLEDGARTLKLERNGAPDPASMIDMFADFRICPTEPFRKGAVQQAKVLSASHRTFVLRH